MQTIHKYTLEVTDTQVVQIPKDAQLLKIDVQHGVPCLWAKVDTTAEKQPIVFRIFGTGHPIPKELNLH